ncbi:hypothetical protein Dimus_007586 [Dionaea muscipula]
MAQSQSLGSSISCRHNEANGSDVDVVHGADIRGVLLLAADVQLHLGVDVNGCCSLVVASSSSWIAASCDRAAVEKLSASLFMMDMLQMLKSSLFHIFKPGFRLVE